MVGVVARRRARRLDDVEAAHACRATQRRRRPAAKAFARADVARLGLEEVAVEREDDARLVVARGAR